MDAADRQDHAVAVDARRRAEVLERELLRERAVVAGGSRRRPSPSAGITEDHHPGAVVELRDREDHRHRRR
jgi:hypothetical protein